MNIIARSEKLILREVELADAAGPYLRWMNDPEIMQFLEARFRTYDQQDLENFISDTLADKRFVFCAMTLPDGRHIGNIKIGPVDRHHLSGDIGLLIGEKDCWGKGYATEAISLLTHFAFQSLGLHKVTAGCYSNNMGSAKAFQRAGFVIEGRRIAQYRSGDQWVDGILMGMVNPDFQEVS